MRLAAVLLLLTLCSLVLRAQNADEFTIAALPDTQFYSKSHPEIFAAETEWIAAHANEKNIKLVVGLGDIVDGGGELNQWDNADAAISKLDRKVPYMLAIGNHDYNHNNPAGRTASATNFNHYFGPARYADRTWYRGSYPAGSNENFYAEMTLGGKPYLILVLEVFPRDQALSWAAGVIASHPNEKVIIVTHAYTFHDNTRMDHCDSDSAASMGVPRDNDGEQTWEKLVRKYPNISLVLSGHVVGGDGTGHRSDIGLHGNLVNQMLSDYQSYANGGNGYIRLITIKPSSNLITVQSYSPYLNEFMRDAHNQFTVPFQNTGNTSLHTVPGVLKNARDCSRMAGLTVEYPGGHTTTDVNGEFSVPLAGSRLSPITVVASGYRVPYNQAYASATAGQPSTEKLFLSSTGRLTGVATVDGRAASGAKITFAGGALRTSTSVTAGSTGSFDSGWIPVGPYDVSFSIPGHTTKHVIKSVATARLLQ